MVPVYTFRFIPIDNIVRVPSDDLQKVEHELEAFRMSAFRFLQPKLQCELGKKTITGLCSVFVT